MSNESNLRNVLLVGDEDSGRVTLCFPLVTGRAYVPGNPVILGRYHRSITAADGREVRLLFMVATTHLFRYRLLEYRRASAIVLCFAADDPRGFRKAARGHWIWEIRKHVAPHVPVFLVANKVDMRPLLTSDDEGRASESSEDAPASESSDEDRTSESSDDDRSVVSADEGQVSDYEDRASESAENIRTPWFVTTEQGRAAIAMERRFSAYFECSAYTKEGVDELLAALIEALVE